MKALLAALCLGLLAGCAGMRLIDAQVQASTAGAPIAAGARYRFERLPSQADEPARAEQLEALAQAALARAGLVHDPAQPRYSVLAGVRVQPYLADAWGRPPGSPLAGSPYGSVTFGAGTGGGMLGWGLRFPPSTSYRHEVSLLLRELASGQVVYETRAAHDGPWADSASILSALFDAALRDFPQATAGPRRVNVEIPR